MTGPPVPPPRPPLLSQLRRQASRAVRATGPPTQEIALGAQADHLAPQGARAVVDLALRCGEALLSTGGSAADVTAAMLNVAKGYGMASVHVDVTYTSVTVSYHRGTWADPFTLMRVVRVRQRDFTRLGRVQELVELAATGRIPVEAARARLDVVVSAPRPYRRWLVTGALGGLGASLAAQLGGGLVMILLSGMVTAGVVTAQRRLGRAGMPPFFTQAIGGAIPAAIAVLVAIAAERTDLPLQDLSPSLLVVTGIVVLLAGLSVVGAAEDALDGYYVTAGARGFEVLLLTLGIVVGIAAVLQLADAAGLDLALGALPEGSAPWPLRVLASMGSAGCFVLAGYAGRRATLAAMASGGAGMLVYLLGQRLDAGAVVASAAGAFVVGAVAGRAGRRFPPGLAISTGGIVPLLPGLAVYVGLFQLAGLDDAVEPVGGLTTLLGAGAVGLAVAAGVSLGTFLTRGGTAVRRQADESDDGADAPRRRAGPPPSPPEASPYGIPVVRPDR